MSASRLTCWFGGAVFGLLCTPAFAAITVGAGSSMQFADSTVDLGCSDLTIAGTASGTAAVISSITNLNLSGSFAPGASQISLGDNFADAGSFTPGTGRVAIVDACGNGTSQVSGATSFYDLAVISALGKQLVLPVGIAQTVAHALTLQGTTGNLLQVSSSATGQRALLALGAGTTQSIAYVNARDNNASGAAIAPGQSAQYHSIDGGNLLNWFANAINGGDGVAVPAPTLGFGRWLLLAGLLLTTWCTLTASKSKRL